MSTSEKEVMMKLNRKLFLCSLNSPEAKKAGAPQFIEERLKPKAQKQTFNLRKVFFLSLFLTLCIGSSQAISSGQLHSGRLAVNNLKRSFLFYVPKHLSEAPKLVFVLHGSGMEAKGMQSTDGRAI